MTAICRRLRLLAWAVLFPATAFAQTTPSVTSSVSAPTTLLTALKSGALSLGVASHHPPFSFIDARAIPQGYAYHLCTRLIVSLAKAQGVSMPAISTVALKPAQRESALNSGRVQLLCDANVITQERAVRWTTPIFMEPMVLISLLKKDYTELAQLKGRRTGTIAGSYANKTLTEVNVAKQLGLSIETQRDFASALAALEKQEIMALWVPASDALATLPRTTFQWDRLDQFTWPLAFSLAAADSSGQAAINQALRRLAKSGEWEAIYRQAFNDSPWYLPIATMQAVLINPQ